MDPARPPDAGGVVVLVWSASRTRGREDVRPDAAAGCGRGGSGSSAGPPSEDLRRVQRPLRPVGAPRPPFSTTNPRGPQHRIRPCRPLELSDVPPTRTLLGAVPISHAIRPGGGRPTNSRANRLYLIAKHWNPFTGDESNLDFPSLAVGSPYVPRNRTPKLCRSACRMRLLLGRSMRPGLRLGPMRVRLRTTQC